MQDFIYYNKNGLDFPVSEKIQVTTSLDGLDNQTFLISNTKDVKSELNSYKITYAIVIPKGFSKELISGKSPKISGWCLKEKNCSSIIRAAVDGFVYAAKRIAAYSRGNAAAFYAAADKITVPKWHGNYNKL